VRQSTSLGFLEKINPKGLDILIKILKLIPTEETL
jgi:hypothetical protein